MAWTSENIRAVGLWRAFRSNKVNEMLSMERIVAIADPILRARLEPFGYQSVEVREGKDEGDEPVLYLKGMMRADAQLVPGDILNSALQAVSGALLEQQEERFPHVILARQNDDLPEIRPRGDN
jgi:hypothetical protein